MLYELYIRSVLNAALIGVIVFAAVAMLYIYGGARDIPVCTHGDLAPAPAPAVGSLVTSGSPLAVRGCIDHDPDLLELGDLKTGDILGISYRGIRSIFSRTVYASNWTHVGLVWVNPASGEPYILEASVYKKPYNAQVVRVPLLYWLRVNRKSAIVSVTSISRTADADVVSAEFAKFEAADIGVQALVPGWIRFLGNRTPGTVAADSMFAAPERRVTPVKKHTNFNPLRSALYMAGLRKPNPEYVYDYVLTCHEIVIATLQAAGVFSSELTACSFLPSALVNGEVPCVNGFAYAPARQVSVGEIADHAVL